MAFLTKDDFSERVSLKVFPDEVVMPPPNSMSASFIASKEDAVNFMLMLKKTYTNCLSVCEKKLDFLKNNKYSFPDEIARAQKECDNLKELIKSLDDGLENI